VSEALRSRVFPIDFAVSTSAALIEGVRINVATLEDAVTEILSHACANRGFTFFTLNLDHLAKVSSDLEFRTIYSRTTFVSADGWPIAWLAARQGAKVDRVCGSDLLAPVCSAAAKAGLPVAFIGPRPSAQQDGVERLKLNYPSLEVPFAESPDFADNLSGARLNALATRLNVSGARLCFLCLGAPKQERLADALGRLCPQIGFLCVGAALGFYAGHALRAPNWLQDAKLEWAWRLLQEPRRLGPRYGRSALAFGRSVANLWV